MEETTEQKPFNGTPILVTLVILMSFFLGSYSTKAQILEKGSSQVIAAAPAQAGTNQPSANAVPAAAQPPAVQQPTKKPQITGNDYIRGSNNAKITLVEYADFECPFCKRFHPTMQQVLKDYGDKVKWVYRHYPLSFHANSQKESEASECAGKLGGNEAFWKYTDAIYDQTTSNGTGFALDQLVPLSKKLGINSASFQTCLDSGEFAQKVKDEFASGSQEGVTGTPGTIIIDAKGNTQLIPGALPYEQVKPLIDAALNAS
jgi:protein-disulfide isomerase